MESNTSRRRRPRSQKRPFRLPFQKEKEPERYYLLPGMGGRLAVEKRKTAMKWALFFGISASLMVGYIIYRFNVR